MPPATETTQGDVDQSKSRKLSDTFDAPLAAIERLQVALSQFSEYEAVIKDALKSRKESRHLLNAKAEADTQIAELERCLGRNTLAEQKLHQLTVEKQALLEQVRKSDEAIQVLKTEKQHLLEKYQQTDEEKMTYCSHLDQSSKEIKHLASRARESKDLTKKLEDDLQQAQNKIEYLEGRTKILEANNTESKNNSKDLQTKLDCCRKESDELTSILVDHDVKDL